MKNHYNEKEKKTTKSISKIVISLQLKRPKQQSYYRAMKFVLQLYTFAHKHCQSHRFYLMRLKSWFRALGFVYVGEVNSLVFWSTKNVKIPHIHNSHIQMQRKTHIFMCTARNLIKHVLNLKWNWTYAMHTVSYMHNIAMYSCVSTEKNTTKIN